jgi:hypothetical protein
MHKLKAFLGKKLVLKSKALKNVNYVFNINLVPNKKVLIIKAFNIDKHICTIGSSYIYLHI